MVFGEPRPRHGSRSTGPDNCLGVGLKPGPWPGTGRGLGLGLDPGLDLGLDLGLRSKFDVL